MDAKASAREWSRPQSTVVSKSLDCAEEIRGVQLISALHTCSRRSYNVIEAMRPWLVHGFCTPGPGHVACTFLCIHCHACLAEAHLNVWKPSKENATCLQSRRLPVLAEDMLPSECAREVVRPGTLHTALVYIYTSLAYPLFLEQLSACKLKACCADLHLWQLSAWAHRILLVSGVATRRTS